MQFDCETARENIDAYAIGVLDAEEARLLEDHLRGCVACADLTEEAREGGTALALAVPLVSSGPSLKARVLASAAVLTEVTRQRRRSHWWQTAAAALVLVSLAGLSWGVFLQRRVDGLGARNATVRVDATAQSDQLATVRTQLVQMTDFNQKLADSVGSQDAVLDVVSQTDVRRIQMEGTSRAPQANGRYLWSSSEQLGALVATGMPALTPGKTYQMWMVYESRWVPGGSFAVDANGRGQLIVRKATPDTRDDGEPLWFCVTIEPASGALTAATGEMVLRSPLQ